MAGAYELSVAALVGVVPVEPSDRVEEGRMIPGGGGVRHGDDPDVEVGVDAHRVEEPAARAEVLHGDGAASSGVAEPAEADIEWLALCGDRSHHLRGGGSQDAFTVEAAVCEMHRGEM